MNTFSSQIQYPFSKGSITPSIVERENENVTLSTISYALHTRAINVTAILYRSKMDLVSLCGAVRT